MWKRFGKRNREKRVPQPARAPWLSALCNPLGPIAAIEGDLPEALDRVDEAVAKVAEEAADMCVAEYWDVAGRVLHAFAISLSWRGAALTDGLGSPLRFRTRQGALVCQ